MDAIVERFRDLARHVPAWSLRLVYEDSQNLAMRQGVTEPMQNRATRGAMITVIRDGGYGYAATGNLTTQGLADALAQAEALAAVCGRHPLLKPHELALTEARGEYASPLRTPWDSWSLTDKLDLLTEASLRLHASDEIVDWRTALGFRQVDTLLATSLGGYIQQRYSYLSTMLMASAHRGTETQRRSYGHENVGQGGLERLERNTFLAHASRVGREALELLDAPNCPTGPIDLLLTPEQMVLQIHESIGHPLELDRILGDERNYAGGSFVSLDMFGKYQYGSPLLNVSFDPGERGEYASYGHDDDGTPARRELLIENGILMRPLGGTSSQQRSGVAGVACTRACDWNRPPIDRMANLNLEPGQSSLGELIGSIEHGILMDTNKSWSIDDRRNKFQFGCELGRAIEHGELKGLIKNPNYRGISGSFWRSLSGVGNRDTFEVLGVSTCGKGEPNQSIHVGHASPACVFKGVEVFGA